MWDIIRFLYDYWWVFVTISIISFIIGEIRLTNKTLRDLIDAQLKIDFLNSEIERYKEIENSLRFEILQLKTKKPS